MQVWFGPCASLTSRATCTGDCPCCLVPPAAVFCHRWLVAAFALPTTRNAANVPAAIWDAMSPHDEVFLK